LQVIWSAFASSNQRLKSSAQNYPSSNRFWKRVWLGVQTSSIWAETFIAWKYIKIIIK